MNPPYEIALSLLVFGAACAARPPAQTATQPARATSAPAEAPSDIIALTPTKLVLTPPARLPDAALDALSLRMERHGEKMLLLMASVLLLNDAIAGSLADELASEPKIGRPAEGEKGTLSALLPSAFFDYQDELGVRAGELARAARAHNRKQMLEALSGVTATCVGCHAAYLYEDVELDEVADDVPDEWGGLDWPSSILDAQPRIARDDHEPRRK